VSAALPTGRRLLALVTSAGVIGVLALYLFREREHIAAQYSLHPRAMLAIAGLSVAILALRGVQNQLVFRRLGVRAPFSDWFGLATVTAFTNYLPLSAGLLAKALYLKRVHETPYRTFAVGQIAILLFVFVANGALALLLLLPRIDGAREAAIAAGFAAMFAVGAALWLPERAGRRVAPGELSAELAAAHALRRAWPGAIACQLGMLACTAQTLRIGFAMGASDVPFSACLIFSAAAVLTSLISITPGGLGIRELLIGALAHLTGFEARDAVIASTLARAGEMLAVFALGGFYTHSLSRRAIAADPRARD
jgi:uncharacterized membrane protein YbhN (UPF0104 family)